MADVSGIGGSDFSAFKVGASSEDNDRQKRPVREDERDRTETLATPVREQTAQASERANATSNPNTDGDAQRNTASTGDFTAGGADRQEDRVVISPEARSVVASRAAADGEEEASALGRGPDGTETAAQGGVAAAAQAGPARAETPARPTAAPAAEDASRTDRAQGPAAAGPAQAAAGVAGNSEPGAPERTNQNVRDENSNARVSGGESDQSEQTRTIGQVVDLFA